MGFLNKIKTSIGLKADENLNKTKDNTNTNLSLQDSQIIKNLDPTKQTQTPTDNPEDLQNNIPNAITDLTPEIASTDNTIPQDIEIPVLKDTNTTMDLTKKDTMTAIPNTNTSIDNPAEKLKSIKDEKERISNQLEKLTAEIDSIITNLEKEFTEETPIKKVKDTKKTETKVNDNKQPNKKETDIEDKNTKVKDKEKQNDSITTKNKKESKSDATTKDANVSEKDLKELEEFLSKEKIKKIAKK